MRFHKYLFHFLATERAYFQDLSAMVSNLIFFYLSNELSKTAHPARQLEVTLLHMCQAYDEATFMQSAYTISTTPNVQRSPICIHIEARVFLKFHLNQEDKPAFLLERCLPTFHSLQQVMERYCIWVQIKIEEDSSYNFKKVLQIDSTDPSRNFLCSQLSITGYAENFQTGRMN